MKCTIPEISWHNREPVLSVDIFPENRDFYRLASGGCDCHVLIWQMTITENGAVNQEVISDITRHQRAVNCVRWSNTGQYLASGDDDGNIIIWQLKTDNIPLLEGDTGDKEIWTIYKVMRGHKEDVYDLCWSMDRMKIFSGSVDNTAILWDVNMGKMDHILTDHKGFVQGVCWDPKNQIIATISTDRICRVFDPCGKRVMARIQKGKLSDAHYLHDKEVKFFHDDTFKSFFRRLQFTPDGSLLIVPSGHIEADGCKHVLNATLVFTLDNFSSPAIILPLPNQSSTVVRCCPILFELHEDGADPIINLPYRMIFAVGTDHDIILYDTQQTVPFARFQDIHYTRLTDLTWSADGLLLIASSTDGFCSLVTFETDELGIPWTKPESEAEENPLDISGCEELALKDENIDTNNKEISVEEKISKIEDDVKEESKKRQSFLKQWTIQKPKKKKTDPEENKLVNGETDDVIEILDSPQKDLESSEQKKKEIPINRLIPRRIATVKVEKGTPVVDTGKKDLCTPEEKINVLVPKRIKPKCVEPKPNTSEKKVKASCSTQKRNELSESIEVLSTKQESDDDEDSSDGEAETLSREEEVELRKASENIKEFFCRVPKKQDSRGVTKTIPVPGKCPSNVQKSDVATTAYKFSDAKPIEVRRKPRDRGVNPKNEAKSEEKTVIGLVKDCSDAELKRPKDEEEKCISKDSEKVDKKSFKDNKKKALDIKLSEDIVWIIDSDNEEYNTTPKKAKSDKSKPPTKLLEDGRPKIKVSSLVKRKSADKTPKKTNALLNFLQKSAEKKKTKKQKDEQETHMDPSLEENEARDAWKCESKQGNEQSIEKNKDADRTVPIENDETEDFCLQLEDSQEGGGEEQEESRSLGKRRDIIGQSNEIKNAASSQCGETKGGKDCGMPKTPRRVKLITLASPKGKSKKE